MAAEDQDKIVRREAPGTGTLMALLSIGLTVTALVTPWPTVCLTVALLLAAWSFLRAAFALSYVGVAASILAAVVYVVRAALSPLFHS
ncbi:hypothetical protein [Reyranella sp.]|uniref:hypothetical protein n=1 Tax=Reyranella sp. TaxID=1929291 RepID=UPI0040365099